MPALSCVSIVNEDLLLVLASLLVAIISNVYCDVCMAPFTAIKNITLVTISLVGGSSCIDSDYILLLCYRDVAFVFRSQSCHPPRSEALDQRSCGTS